MKNESSLKGKWWSNEIKSSQAQRCSEHLHSTAHQSHGGICTLISGTSSSGTQVNQPGLSMDRAAKMHGTMYPVLISPHPPENGTSRLDPVPFLGKV